MKQLYTSILYLLVVMFLTINGEIVLAQTNIGSMPSGALDQVNQSIIWQDNLNGALFDARYSKKLVFIDLYTTWCAWCKKLERDTYTNPYVIQLLNHNFICVKLNGEDGGAGQDFAKQHRVRGYPCLMALNGQGSVLSINYGYRAPREFIDLLKKIIKESNK